MPTIYLGNYIHLVSMGGHLVTWDPVGLASVFVRMLYLHGPHRLAKGAQELQRSWEAGEGSGATCTAVWVRAS